jgi:hypothetical protein
MLWAWNEPAHGKEKLDAVATPATTQTIRDILV